jgi:hypothetical protein
MTNTDHHPVVIHGLFGTTASATDPISDSTDRVALGTYWYPPLEDQIANHIPQVMGSTTTPVSEHIRSNSHLDVERDAIETFVASHPVYGSPGSRPDVILHIDVDTYWRARWDTLLEYPDSNNSPHDRSLSVKHSPSDAPSLNTDTPSPCIIHSVDGQDMHRPIKIAGSTEATNITDAFTDLVEATPLTYPPNWEFEFIEVSSRHFYNSDSLSIP